MPKSEKIYPQSASFSQSVTSFLADVYDSVEYLTMPVHHNNKAALNSMQLLHLYPVQHASIEGSSSTTYTTHVPGHAVITPPPRPSKIADLWHDPRVIYQHTRMSAAEFSIIVTELTPYLNQPYDYSSSSSVSDSASASTSSSTSPRQQRPLQCSQHRVLNVFDQLLLWCYFSDTNHAEVNSTCFNVSTRSVTNIADHVTKSINQRYNYEIEWPDEEERKTLHGLFSVHPMAIALLDGTHCRIVVPTDRESEDSTFSGYKNYHSQNYLVYTDGLGFFRLIEGPFAGKANDRSVFKQSVIFTNPSAFLSTAELMIIRHGDEETVVTLKEGKRIMIAEGLRIRLL